MPKRGRKRKKTRTHNAALEAGEHHNLSHGGDLMSGDSVAASKIPKSLVIRRGKTETIVTELVHDIRKIMMPYTAINFKEDATYRKLTLSKYCQHVCLPLGVSHILAITQNEDRLNLKIAKLPQGPTLSFRMHRFSLIKHVQKLQKRPMNINSRSITANPPIVVTNNFGDVTAPPHIKLMRITFQNMFPAINVANVRLKECKRVVLFHLIENETNEEDGDGTPKKTQRVEVRHYAIKATPVGINRKVRRLIQTKIPNLNKVQDIADYISGSGAGHGASNDPGSDSEPEDGSNAIVELTQNYDNKNGNTKNNKSALKLVELGPRLCLELIKVEQGLGGNEGGTSNAVMYHAHVTKTKEEIDKLESKKQNELMLKQQRKRQQELNVEKKLLKKKEKRDAKKLRRELKQQNELDELRNANKDNEDSDSDEDDVSSSDEEEDEQIVQSFRTNMDEESGSDDDNDSGSDDNDDDESDSDED